MTTSDFTTAAPIGSGRRKSQPLASSREEKSPPPEMTAIKVSIISQR